MAATDPPPLVDRSVGPPSRVSTRTLAAVVVALVVVLLLSALVSVLLLRQPRLEPVPVPSVSQI